MFVGYGQIKRLERSKDFLTCFSCSHLLHFLPVPTVMEKHLQEAQLYKEEGNQSYQQGKYQDAVSRYQRALFQLQDLDPSLPSPIPNLGPQGPALKPEQENRLHAHHPDRLLQQPSCLSPPDGTSELRTSEGIQSESPRTDNAKAFYQAGVAFSHLQDYDQA